MAAKYKTLLRNIREATGKKGAQVAREIGVDRRTYSTWETGHVKIDSDRIVELCAYFGCTPNELMGIPERSLFIQATPDEVTLVKLWRQLNPNERHLVMDLITSLGNR